MNNERIAIITEGDVRELDIFENIKKMFFKSDKVDVIAFPAGENIYMLWKQLKDDEFQTDVIELVREQNEKAAKIIEDYSRDDFSEIYLFFDYDGHQDNLKTDEDDTDVIQEMLDTFNNETENGLLYVNYPMVEAIRDYVEEDCATQTSCYLPIADSFKYKKLSSVNKVHNDMLRYTINNWEQIIDAFTRRLACLTGAGEVHAYDDYKSEITPSYVYDQQKEIIEKGYVFVLSAFPEFLLDYNKADFWHRMVKHKSNREYCDKGIV